VSVGDLPGTANPCGHADTVDKVDDTAPSDDGLIDEGRAMAQIVHDLAPGARLKFATAAISETSFANNVTALATVGSDVIVDDIGYLAEPFYQDGPISVAVNAARADGVAFFSAAGNDNVVVAGKEVGSYEAVGFRATGCPALPYTYLDCHSFAPSGVDVTAGMTVPSNRDLVLDLQWAQPRGGVTSDIDIFVLNASTGAVLEAGTSFNNGTGTQQPFEYVGFHNGSGSSVAVNVVVARYAGPAPSRFKWIHIGDSPSSVEYSTSSATDVFGPTIFGHSGAAGAVSIAAVPFDNAAVAETYSSRGPVTLLFAPVPSTSPLGSPQVLGKPDLAATDCGRNSFFPPGSPPPHRFCGTSAAAPHAAAIAALLLDAQPAATPAEIISTLQSTAVAVGSAPATAVGAGLIDARAAVAAVVLTEPGDPSGDYDGNGTTDIAIYRPSNGGWYVRNGAGATWGTSGDIPVPGDYDGNGTTDIAVYRPSNGGWYVRNGAGATWGTSGDIPVPGDYDGNGTTDIAVYRPSSGGWYVRNGTGATWGASGDIPLVLPYAIRSVI
jgi:hypothetical protein